MSLETTVSGAAPSRPAIHFTPAKGWMNDPNGLVYFDGEYHLFYQYYPDARVWGPMHWGHAVSTDLLHWQHLDTALFPDEDGMCFSGSAVVDHRDCSGLFGGEPGLIAFYTAHRVLDEATNDYIEEQCVAYSRDRGRSWQKYAGNPVIAPPGFRDFRDPKVIWHEASQHWIMALACGQSIRFYRSENLLDWTLASAFGSDQGAHTEGPWECPDLFELALEDGRRRWVLVVGVGAGKDDWGSFTQYFVGDFDGTGFHNENPADQVLLMDESRDFYAAQSWSDVTDGRRLAIAWLNNWHYANQIPESGWRGNMSLPRELALVTTAEGTRLQQRFVRELAARFEPVPLIDDGVGLAAGQSFQAPVDKGPQLGRAALSLQAGSRVEICLQQAGYADLVLSLEEAGLRLQHQRRGQNGDEKFDRFFPHDFSIGAGEGNSVTLEWVCDHGSLELLVDNGRLSLSSLSISGDGGCASLFRVTEGEVVLESLYGAAIRLPARGDRAVA
ncbi:glycoside hydrolase family 32 protein [Marinobacterium aestuariivivens]|uniref:Glycoside hydrolase family 32 protein n=1 Tax=Marinobacterium aestuariivivens TaxID=1698799 RepID=A0ABW2A608_9GAMM